MTTGTCINLPSTVERKSTRCLLRPGDVRPSCEGFAVVGVINPGVTEIDNRVHMLVRVAEAPIQNRPGYIGLRRADLAGGYDIDWFKHDDVTHDDPRVVTINATGCKRPTCVSHLRLALCDDAIHLDWVDDQPTFVPEQPPEAYGIEDPRITRIGDTYWITYVAVSEHGIATALASSTDLRSFDRHGIIFPTENKDVVLFPQPLADGRYAALHRPYGNAPLGSREIWSARSPDLLHWGDHQRVVKGGDMGDCRWVGAGAPPVRIDEGWLVVYHGVHPRPGGGIGSYHARGMILDHDNPARVLWQGPEPILEPDQQIECSGFVSDILFVTGAVTRDDDLYLYFGASDTATALTVVDKGQVIEAIKGRCPDGARHSSTHHGVDPPRQP